MVNTIMKMFRPRRHVQHVFVLLTTTSHKEVAYLFFPGIGAVFLLSLFFSSSS